MCIVWRLGYFIGTEYAALCKLNTKTYFAPDLLSLHDLRKSSGLLKFLPFLDQARAGNQWRCHSPLGVDMMSRFNNPSNQQYLTTMPTNSRLLLSKYLHSIGELFQQDTDSQCLRQLMSDLSH